MKMATIRKHCFSVVMLLVSTGCEKLIRPQTSDVEKLSVDQARSTLTRVCKGQFLYTNIYTNRSTRAIINGLRFNTAESFEISADDGSVNTVPYQNLLQPIVHHVFNAASWIDLNPGLSIWFGYGYKDDYLHVAEALMALKNANHAERSMASAPSTTFPAVSNGQTLAVAQLEPQNVSAGDSAVISDLFRSELIRQSTFKVVEKTNMEKVLREQAFQQTGCTSQECAVKLGKILNVKYLVVGSFGKLLDRYVLNIRVVDVESAQAVYSDNEQGKDVQEVQQGITRLATRLSKVVAAGK